MVAPRRPRCPVNNALPQPRKTKGMLHEEMASASTWATKVTSIIMSEDWRCSSTCSLSRLYRGTSTCRRHIKVYSIQQHQFGKTERKGVTKRTLTGWDNGLCGQDSAKFTRGSPLIPDSQSALTRKTWFHHYWANTDCSA